MNQSGVKSLDSRTFVRRIVKHLEKSLESFIEIGHVLIEAEKLLGRKQWLDMVSEELPFTRRTAEKLVKIASDARITDPKIRGRLPPHWTSLHELTQLTDAEFANALVENKIRPEMERREISLLRHQPVKISKKNQASSQRRQAHAAPISQLAMTATIVSDDDSDAYAFALGIVRLSKTCRFQSIALSKELLEAVAEQLRRYAMAEEEDIRQHTAQEDVDYLEDMFFQFETGKTFIDTSGQRHKDRDISRPDRHFEDIQHLYDYCATGRFMTKYTPLKFLEPRAYCYTLALRSLDADQAVRTAALLELQQFSATEPVAAELLELFA